MATYSLVGRLTQLMVDSQAAHTRLGVVLALRARQRLVVTRVMIRSV